MILLWFLVGLFLAGIIARMNKSNKLFWILFVSYMTGIAGVTLYKRCTENRSKENPVQVCSTQVSHSVVCVTDLLPCEPTVEIPTPVSQNTPDNNEISFALSKCCASADTPPPRHTIPQLCLNTLTRPDVLGHSV